MRNFWGIAGAVLLVACGADPLALGYDAGLQTDDSGTWSDGQWDDSDGGRPDWTGFDLPDAMAEDAAPVDAGPSPDATVPDAGPVDAGPDAGDGCVEQEWYFDGDQDGHRATVRGVIACEKPPGPHVTNGPLDCDDSNAKAYSGQTEWFAEDRGDGSFDYDCRRGEEKESEVFNTCVLGGTWVDGWTATNSDGTLTPLPSCGETGKWVTYIAACHGYTIEDRVMRCH